MCGCVCVQNRALTRVSLEVLDAQVTPTSHTASTIKDTETSHTGSVIRNINTSCTGSVIRNINTSCTGSATGDAEMLKSIPLYIGIPVVATDVKSMDGIFWFERKQRESSF